MNDAERMPTENPAIQWRGLARPDQVAQALIDLFDQSGHHHYDEVVTQTSHAVQCAELARAVGASDDLVLAALLHDVGHLLEPPHDPRRSTVDFHHERLGARFLANWFLPGVTEPIRLHVVAKRYLCRIDSDYAEGLSAASTTSLELQGGPLDNVEVGEFESTEWHREAVELRRWDDLAKQADFVAQGLEEFRDQLERAAAAGHRERGNMT